MTDVKAILNGLFGTDEDDDDSNDDNDSKEEASAAEGSSNQNVSQSTHIKNGLSLGGGRGIFTNNKNVKAGTLLLAETPTMTWDGLDLNEKGGLSLAIRKVLSDNVIYESCKYLHPFDLTSYTPEDIDLIISEVIGGNEIIESIIQEYSVEINDVVRLALVLQFNSLKSGLYLNVSMFNHSCEPNCIVFTPSSSSNWMAEVWATKDIASNEECFICYAPATSTLILPQEQSFASISSYLLDQHKFVCACRKCTNEKDVTDVNSDFEAELLELERQVLLSKLHSPLDLMKISKSVIKWVDRQHDINEIAIQLKSRATKLAVSAAATTLELLQNEQCDKNIHAKLKYFALNFLIQSLLLVKYQIQYLGEYHPDLARTYFDIAESMTGLIQNDIDFFLVSIKNSTKNSDLSHLSLSELKEKARYYRKESIKIQTLYNRRKNYPQSLNNKLSLYWG